MIFSDSRYADGNIFKAYDARRQHYKDTAFRVFPEEAVEFYYYTWVEGDRLDILANEFYGQAEQWWRILDFNPEVIDGLDIPVGTVIRIPNG